MLNESQQKPEPIRQHSTHKKKTGWKANDFQIEIEKGKEEKEKKKISQHQQRKKEDSTQGDYAYFRLARSAGGGAAPRRGNRITESATKESREAKIKAKKTIQESNGKRQDERTNTNEQGTRDGTRRTKKGEEKTKKEKKKRRKKEK